MTNVMTPFSCMVGLYIVSGALAFAQCKRNGKCQKRRLPISILLINFWNWNDVAAVFIGIWTILRSTLQLILPPFNTYVHAVHVRPGRENCWNDWDFFSLPFSQGEVLWRDILELHVFLFYFLFIILWNKSHLPKGQFAND